MIKISFCTYEFGKDWDLEKLAKVAKEVVYEGVESAQTVGINTEAKF